MTLSELSHCNICIDN